MDKVLAFSILSASPADIAPGAGSGWARFSWQRQGRRPQDDDDQARAGQEGKQAEAEQQPGKGKPPTLLPRFAPEFDGIDCFGTIVCH